MQHDNLIRLKALLPGSGLPDDLQQWTLTFIQDALYSQRRRDALLAIAIKQARAQTLPGRCQKVIDALQGQSDDPVICELKNWPEKVPTSVRHLKTISKKVLSG